jgi:hypothetical protein
MLLEMRELAYAKYDSHCRKLHMRVEIEKGCDPRFYRLPPGPGTVLFSQATAPGENRFHIPPIRVTKTAIKIYSRLPARTLTSVGRLIETSWR